MRPHTCLLTCEIKIHDFLLTALPGDIQGPSFKLILWFLHNNTHLGFFFENVEVGKETCAIQASNEPLIDEIDRTSDEL